MSENTAAVWCCDVCGHEWLKGIMVPTHCASSKCRSRKWNAGAGRTVELNREEGSDRYEVVYLLNDNVQGVIEYPHEGHWPRMMDEIDAWRKNGVVPAEYAL